MRRKNESSINLIKNLKTIIVWFTIHYKAYFVLSFDTYMRDYTIDPSQSKNDQFYLCTAIRKLDTRKPISCVI